VNAHFLEMVIVSYFASLHDLGRELWQSTNSVLQRLHSAKAFIHGPSNCHIIPAMKKVRKTIDIS